MFKEMEDFWGKSEQGNTQTKKLYVRQKLQANAANDPVKLF